MVVIVAMVVAIMLVVVRLIMSVAMSVIVRVIMRMIVMMLVRAIVRIAMAVVMMAMIMIMIMIVMVVVMRLALRFEGPHHHGECRALTADQFIKARQNRRVKRFRSRLHRHVVAAKTPGEPRQPRGVFNANFVKFFISRANAHETAIIELQGVSIFQCADAMQMNVNVQAVLRHHVAMMISARPMVENDDIGDALLLHGGLADDGLGAFRHQIDPRD